MKKFNQAHIKAINISLFILGMSMVLFSVSIQSKSTLISGGLNALGIALATTGLVTLLDRALRPESKPIGPEKIAGKRKETPQKIHARKDSAEKVDVLGISLLNFLVDVLTDQKQRFVKNVLDKPKTRVRLMFVHPDAVFFPQRAHDDGDITLEKLIHRQIIAIEYCVLLHTLLKNKTEEKANLKHDFEPFGYLKIKLIEACPYISYERFDYDIYWGLYTADAPGTDAPVFLTTSSDGELYEKLKAHFKALLDRGYENPTEQKNKDNTLLKVTYQGPWLNDELVREFLSPERLEELKAYSSTEIINNLRNISNPR